MIKPNGYTKLLNTYAHPTIAASLDISSMSMLTFRCFQSLAIAFNNPHEDTSCAFWRRNLL